MRSMGVMAAVLAALACVPAAAQECAPPASADSVDARGRRPDVVIVATVQARELRFESEPRAQVRVNGCTLPDSVYVTERANLPRDVQPGVTYRDVRVGVEIRAWVNVGCLPALAAADPELCAPLQVQTTVTPPAADAQPANPPGRER